MKHCVHTSVAKIIVCFCYQVTPFVQVHDYLTRCFITSYAEQDVTFYLKTGCLLQESPKLLWLSKRWWLLCLQILKYAS
jgi:hypothetical protein